MEPRHLTNIALVLEGLVGVVGIIWMALRDLPFRTGPVPWSLAIGFGAALLLALINYWMLEASPDLPLVRTLRRVYRELLEPLFARAGARQIVLISLAAGICEELLFRGAVQAEWGLIPASLLFGAAHLGGSGTFGFGIWAAIIGSFLGGLAMWTGGLVAPMVAHAAYDAMALAYIRWRAQ
jgi:membrane protease YdiL (CAAX protease family)